jgi:hypothetical protein
MNKITQVAFFDDITMLNDWLKKHSFVDVKDVKYQVLPGGWGFYLVIFQVDEIDLEILEGYNLTQINLEG